MRSLEEKFIAVCDEYLSSRNGYDIRGEQGLFSFAMIVWLGIQQRLSGYSLRSSLNELASRAVDNGGIGFLVGRTNQKIRTATISTNNGGLFFHCRGATVFSTVEGLLFPLLLDCRCESRLGQSPLYVQLLGPILSCLRVSSSGAPLQWKSRVYQRMARKPCVTSPIQHNQAYQSTKVTVCEDAASAATIYSSD